VAVDPVIVLVGAYRVVGSLFVLRWPFWGAIAAVVCDLFDLLLFNLFVVYGDWSGFSSYQAFDKWADQVYLAAFLVVAVRQFAPRTRRIAIALYAFRLVGFVAFEAGLAPRDSLFLFPNLFEFWFLAVAFTMRYRPTFEWTRRRSAVVLGVLLVAKLAQEWALHVGRIFDATTFLEALDWLWRSLLGVFGSS